MSGKRLIGRFGMNLHWNPEYLLGAVGDVTEPCQNVTLPMTSNTIEGPILQQAFLRLNRIQFVSQCL